MVGKMGFYMVSLMFVDKEDNLFDDVINKQLLDRTIDGISDGSEDGFLDSISYGILDGIPKGKDRRRTGWK